MGSLERKSFARGWVPDADAVNAPADGLLRMDNGILDELGVVALRYGSAKINSCAYADTDIHSLFTAVATDGTRYRFAGAGASVYQNGTSIASSLAGLGDIQFGSYQGQVFFARSTSKKKTDGTTVRNWGIAMTGGVITAASAGPDSKTFVSGASTESPALSWTEDSGAGAAYTTGHDGVANGAAVLHQALATGRGSLTKTFAAPTNFTSYDAGATAAFEDALEIYIYVTEPLYLNGIKVVIDVNSGDFATDYYWGNITPNGFDTPVAGGFLDPIKKGWNRYAIQRQFMVRNGATSGKDWTTVKGVQIIAIMTGAVDNALYFQGLRVYGGTNYPISGNAIWKYVYARNTGTYTALSAPSAASAALVLEGGAGTLTVPADASRDSQINEIWVYRFDDALGDYYRVSVKTGVSGTGTVAITDATSDADALTTDLVLEDDNAVPPDTIISIAGPYFSRLFALTATDLYVSRQRNPDSFAAGQVVHISGADEQAFWVVKSFSGLFIGTSKDIYALVGTGAEYPDGSIDFTLRAMNVDHPPIAAGFAQEGNQLIYLADDGWRAFAGQSSTPLSGATSLLYRGQTRHGVSAVNLTGGRFRGAIVKGQFAAITPEGASTTTSSVVYRQVFAGGAWYRHVYPQAFRSIFREPDGTLIAGDAAGFVRVLDTGTQDDGANIALTWWTKVDDDAMPYNRKDPWDFATRMDTGSGSASVAVHLDGSGSAAGTLTITLNGEAVSTQDISTYGVFRQAQLRITGTLATCRLYDFCLNYRERPKLMVFAEPKPKMPSRQRRRFSAIQVIADTLSGDATVTPMLDGAAQSTITLNTSDAKAKTLTFASVVGRDLWAKIAKATGFELYELEPIVLDTLPPTFKGTTPRSNFGYPGVKTISGLQLRVCTLGAARTFTPIFDGVSQTTFQVTSGTDDPTDYTHDLTASAEVVEVSFSVDGDIEDYGWRPIVTARRPLGVKAWTSGPIDLGAKEINWVREFFVKVRPSATDLTVTPYFDGVAFDATTVPVIANRDTVVPIPIGRAFFGRQPQIVLTSSGAFYPYWTKVVLRTSGLVTGKNVVTVPATLEIGGGQ